MSMSIGASSFSYGTMSQSTTIIEQQTPEEKATVLQAQKEKKEAEKETLSLVYDLVDNKDATYSKNLLGLLKSSTNDLNRDLQQNQNELNSLNYSA